MIASLVAFVLWDDLIISETITTKHIVQDYATGFYRLCSTRPKVVLLFPGPSLADDLAFVPLPRVVRSRKALRIDRAWVRDRLTGVIHGLSPGN